MSPPTQFNLRYDEWDDIISTTSQVMLGLTVGCARCHDHKIDPIPQADYYGLVGIFRRHHSVWQPRRRGDQQSMGSFVARRGRITPGAA